jgi:ABC-type transport system substrate-binding protein
MKSRLVSLVSGLLLLMAAILVATPAPGWAQESKVKRLVFASAGFDESNRFWTMSRPDHLQYDPFLETLLEVDPKTSEYKPRLATKWSHSQDFLEWTFELRKGVQFHNGWGEFTSADVKHVHSLLVRPDSTATLAPLWRQVEEVRTPDKYTVVFRFKRPVTSLLFGAARSGDLRIVSKAQWDKEGLEGWEKNPAGTGVYEYAGRKPGLNITFKRSKMKHWSGVQPSFEELEFRITREEATRLALLLSGEAHIGDLPRELHKEALSKGLKRFQSSAPVDWVSIYMGGQYYMPGDKAFKKEVPWTDKRVRQALNISIDRKEMLNTVFAGRAKLAALSAWQPQDEGWNPKWESRFNELYAYNPKKARELLKEAGYGPGELKMKIWAFTSPGESEGPLIADALGVYFKNVGVDAQIEILDWSKIREGFRKKTIHCCLWPNIIGWRPAEDAIRTFYYSQGNNHHYESEFLDKNYLAWTKTTDPKERAKYARAIGDHLLEEFADIPLFWFSNEVFANSKVVGSWVYPGMAAGRSTHFELVRPPQ